MGYLTGKDGRVAPGKRFFAYLVLGTVRAGVPQPASDEEFELLSVEELFIREPNKTAMCHIRGDSMKARSKSARPRRAPPRPRQLSELHIQRLLARNRLSAVSFVIPGTDVRIIEGSERRPNAFDGRVESMVALGEQVAPKVLLPHDAASQLLLQRTSSNGAPSRSTCRYEWRSAPKAFT